MQLPDRGSERLAHSPLVLVACQVNFEDVARDVTHKQARDVQRRLGAAWVHLQAAPLITAGVTPVGVITEPNRSAWRLLAPDGGWAVLLNPNSATIETRAYTRWSSFSVTLRALLDAVAEVFDPGVEQRLGLRYVDQVPMPAEAKDWKGLIPDELLGAMILPGFQGSVLGAEQRLVLAVDEERRCLLRHGLMVDPEGIEPDRYLLDFDVFRETGSVFDVTELMSGAQRLHEAAGALFRATITDKFYDLLKG